MASSNSDVSISLDRQRPDSDGYGSAREPPIPSSRFPQSQNQKENLPASSGENILLASARSETFPKNIFTTAPQLMSRSNTHTNATPSGEVQMRRARISNDNEMGVNDNLTNQCQLDMNAVEGIRGTQVPEGRVKSSQVPVTNSDYTDRRCDEWSGTATHALTRYSGLRHDPLAMVDADNGQSASAARGMVLVSSCTLQRPSTWGHHGGRDSR